MREMLRWLCHEMRKVLLFLSTSLVIAGRRKGRNGEYFGPGPNGTGRGMKAANSFLAVHFPAEMPAQEPRLGCDRIPVLAHDISVRPSAATRAERVSKRLRKRFDAVTKLLSKSPRNAIQRSD